VRHRHRHGAHADHPAHAEALDDLADGAGEGLPPDVGLGTGEEQERRTAGVAHRADDQPGRLVVGVVVADEGHRGPAGAVVVQRVDVEGGHHLALRQVGQVPRGQLRGLAGVEETGEDDDEGEVTGIGEHLGVVDDVHESVGHG
jgi:hypothetical protein